MCIRDSTGTGHKSTLTYPNGTVITADGGGQGGHWDGTTGRDGGCGGAGSSSPPKYSISSCIT